jgi:hypothetical protein
MQAYGLEGSYFGQHFAPVLLLLLPLYAAWPSPLFLLVVQGVVAGLTVLAVGWLAGRVGVPPWWGLLAGFVVTLHPGYWRGFRFDFHQEMLFPLLLVLAVGSLAARRFVPAFAWCLLALTLKEDAALYVGLFGGLVALTASGRWGLALAGTALAWAVLAFAVAIPFFAPPAAAGPPLLGRYDHYGATWPEIAGNLLRDAPRVGRVAFATAWPALLKPLLFVPLVSPGYFALGLVAVMPNVASGYAYQAQLGVYYGVPALAFFAVGYLVVLGRLFRGARLTRAAAAVILLGSFLLVDIPLWRRPLPEDRALARHLAALSAAGGPLSVNSVLVPHLPRDRRVHLFPRVDDADIVALYLRPGDEGPWLVEPRRFLEALFALVEGGAFRIRVFDGATLILERGPVDAERARRAVDALRTRYRHHLGEAPAAPVGS